MASWTAGWSAQTPLTVQTGALVYGMSAGDRSTVRRDGLAHVPSAAVRSAFKSEHDSVVARHADSQLILPDRNDDKRFLDLKLSSS